MTQTQARRGQRVATPAHGVNTHSKQIRRTRQLLAKLGANLKEASGIQWELGDIAIEVAGPARGSDGSAALETFVKEVDGDYTNFASYRRVATAFPPDTRGIDMPWTCFRAFVAQDDPPATARKFFEWCQTNNRKPTWRATQEFQGKTPTSEFSKAKAETAARQALATMEPEQREAVIAEAVAQSPVTHRQELLRGLVADPEVLHPVVNDRGNAYASPVEQAFFQARADHVAQVTQDVQGARQASKEMLEQAALNTPGLTNQRMIDTMNNRVRNDAQRYMQLARDIAEPVLQAHAARLEGTRADFQFLLQAVQQCLDALPESTGTAADDDPNIIDGKVREVIDRFMLVEAK